MKYLLYILLFCSLSFISFTEKSKDFRPPGTTKIVDNFYFDEGEITNIDWKEYLSSLELEFGKSSPQYLGAFPDTLVWRNSDGKYNEPYVKTYFQHPAFDYYPVVGVSHEQAKNYCKWRTKAVKKMMATHGKEADFEYRLPTKTEWELVAKAGFNKKQKKKLKKTFDRILKYPQEIYEQEYFYNMSWEVKSGKKHVHMIRRSRSYCPNKYNIYHIYGNVAEMIDEPNIAMGGSWKDKYEDIVPNNKILQYDGPKNWLGFRCVAEIFDK